MSGMMCNTPFFFNALNHRLVIFSFAFNCTQRLVPKCACGKIHGLKFVYFKLGITWNFFVLIVHIHVYMTATMA